MASSSITYFLIVSQRTAPGLISDQLMKDFKVSASTIGLMASIQFLAYASLQIPIGILSDRYGPNRFLIIGALLCGLGTILYSIAPNEFVLILARLLEVGVVSGFANTGGFLSAVLLPSIFGTVLDHFHTASSTVGYHYGFIIPVLFSLCGLIGVFLIKDRQKERSN